MLVDLKPWRNITHLLLRPHTMLFEGNISNTELHNFRAEYGLSRRLKRNIQYLKYCILRLRQRERPYSALKLCNSVLEILPSKSMVCGQRRRCVIFMASGQPACKLNSFLGTRLSQDSKQIWISDDSKDVLYSHIIIYFRITYLRIQTKRSMCYRLNLPTRTKYPTKNMLGSRCLWRYTQHI